MNQTTIRNSLAGATFEYWEVQDSYITTNNKRKWLCKCRCGTVRYVSENNLISGKSKSCGCLSAGLKKERCKDLSGQIFGWLKVVERAPENRHGRVSWICECKCGTKCIVTGHELQQKKTKSCGCLRKVQTRAADLSNQPFGRLTALYPTGKRDHKGSVIWHCSCECGGEIDVPQDRLTGHNTKSCGCLKEEHQASIADTLHFIDGTCVEFLKRKQRSDNTSGHAGVYQTKNGKYRAGIGFKGKRYYLGTYDTFEEAVTVREYAVKVLHDAFVKQYDEWTKGTGLNPDQTEENPPLQFSPDARIVAFMEPLIMAHSLLPVCGIAKAELG